ncbi:hypothetical protein LguiB_028225 [Lonicera macranthoides]
MGDEDGAEDYFSSSLRIYENGVAAFSSFVTTFETVFKSLFMIFQSSTTKYTKGTSRKIRIWDRNSCPKSNINHPS